MLDVALHGLHAGVATGQLIEGLKVVGRCCSGSRVNFIHLLHQHERLLLLQKDVDPDEAEGLQAISNREEV